MDAFYASVEQRDNPALRGQPVAVGHGRARGVVAAASYEARAFGVHSAMPSVTALRKCPELVFVPPRFEVYRVVSQKIREIFARRTPLIEPLALDEAYLDVTDYLAEGETAASAAEDIRAAILSETGLTASAGVSYNKFLAKMASGQRKPNGQFVISPKMGPAFVEALPVKRFHGVGPATAEKMRRLRHRDRRGSESLPAGFFARSISARREVFSTPSRAELTSARCGPTAPANRSARKTPFWRMSSPSTRRGRKSRQSSRKFGPPANAPG